MAFAGWLAFVMLIGAAKADASPEQAAGARIKRIRVSGPWREVPDAD